MARTAKQPISQTDAVLSALERIQPEIRTSRFLQSWQPATRHVVFGIGDGQQSLRIHGDGLIEEAESSTRARFSKGVIEGNRAADGRESFERIRTLLNSFAHFDDARVSTLLTLWSMGTYLYTVFTHYGYVFLFSKWPRSGKTRVLEVMSHLAFEATVPLNAPTTATIREIASEGRTLQLDTLERWKGKSPEAHCAAMELLDAGFRNGGTVAKMVPFDGGWRRESYPVYAPYALAAIDKDSLSDTALDRSFAIEMHRKSIKIRTRVYHFHRFERECQPIREDLYFWALKMGHKVAEIYESKQLEDFVNGVQLHDRAADIWKPIFAVAWALDLATSDVAALAREMGGDPGAAEDRRQLAILNSLLAHAHNGEVVGTTSHLQKHSDVDHSLLTAWGFTQKKGRIDGGQPGRVWVLPRHRLTALAKELGNG